MGSRSPDGKRHFWGGNGRTTIKYKHTLRSSVQKQLNQSRCRLGCGLTWAQSIMCYMGSPDPHLKGQFWWIVVPVVIYKHFLPSTVQKRLNRSICHLGCRLEWAEGYTNSIIFTRWRQCAIMGGHIAVTCRNTEPSVYGGDAPYVKLLWPLVIFGHAQSHR